MKGQDKSGSQSSPENSLLVISAHVPIRMFMFKNLVIRYISQYRGNSTIYRNILRYYRHFLNTKYIFEKLSAPIKEPTPSKVAVNC